MGVNGNSAALIYSDMLRYRKFPEDLFIGSEEKIKALKAALGIR
jgi:hypothetical protein